jgi:hypothetical protein
MSARPLLLDFKSAAPQGGLAGLLILLLGLGGAGFAIAQYRSMSETRAGLELKLDVLSAAQNRGAQRIAASPEEAGPLVNELGAPWSLLLEELEAASQDLGGSVAILAVEPDRQKGHLKIAAEAKDIDTALAYIRRLQRSKVLKYPMLESHEVRTDDKDQPVRVQISAQWRTDA